MKTFLVLAMALLTTFAMAQSLEPFERIVVSGNVELTLVKGDTEKYEVSGDTEGLKVKVDQGKLKISRTDIFEGWDNPVRVTVTYRNIRSLYASAGSKIAHDGTLHAGDFELSVDTGASGKLELDAESLDVRVGEGGVLRLDGNCRTMEASATTGGVLKAHNCKAKSVYAKANTGAMVNVHATESIEATASLGGMVSFDGNPEHVKVKESLGGAVKG